MTEPSPPVTVAVAPDLLQEMGENWSPPLRARINPTNPPTLATHEMTCMALHVDQIIDDLRLIQATADRAAEADIADSLALVITQLEGWTQPRD